MLNQLKREYELEASKRRDDAYLLCPELLDISEQRRALTYRLGLVMIAADDPVSVREEVLKKIGELNDKEARLLTELGFSQDYFLPRYRCAKCGDTGFTGDAKTKPCICYLERLSKMNFASSNLNSGESFENFEFNIFLDLRQRALMQKAKVLCEKYADGIPGAAEKQNILLMGKPGLGKTYLLNCIALRALQRGVRVLKLTSYNLIARILKSIKEGGDLSELTEVSLLCVDDLGTEPMTANITREYIFAILNERLNAKLNTVFATNLSFDTIQELYDERVFSRLVSPRYCSVLMLEGYDVRLKLK